MGADGCKWHLAENTVGRAADLRLWEKAELGSFTCEPTRAQEGSRVNKPLPNFILNTSMVFGMPAPPLDHCVCICEGVCTCIEYSHGYLPVCICKDQKLTLCIFCHHSLYLFFGQGSFIDSKAHCLARLSNKWAGSTCLSPLPTVLRLQTHATIPSFPMGLGIKLMSSCP